MILAWASEVPHEGGKCACATFRGCRNELHDALRRLTPARPAGHFIFLFVRLLCTLNGQMETLFDIVQSFVTDF